MYSQSLKNHCHSVSLAQKYSHALYIHTYKGKDYTRTQGHFNSSVMTARHQTRLKEFSLMLVIKHIHCILLHPGYSEKTSMTTNKASRMFPTTMEISPKLQVKEIQVEYILFSMQCQWSYTIKYFQRVWRNTQHWHTQKTQTDYYNTPLTRLGTE